ncbi:MAG: hypothetical protein HOB84_13565 [Candidatus Marinimicrobia bacterium]|jgi:hypothetical protein|nr:hypothetical protein [Candidatus Neomarinimicrobiota bacterium]MBT4362348.1 hypothetical protein [Candidatus Neomarinimicrobiota bacterium]MBT4715791.1 hypothetical protein [Candidatus Neomarinimicrobiota bacterium]MBT4944884.1 hypothetical protein [Candidatus Neomarinimicrobiota bacterium]MBT5270246.1 hypothetical protein [Candidatus Neomarinimicrobiota bacterium]
MTLKEKLELLWKYLLLAVIVFGLAQIGRTHHPGMMKHNFSGAHGDKMMWFGDDDCDFGDMDVDVEIEKFGEGDSSIKIIINGETMGLDDLEKLGDNIFIKKMKHDGGGKEHKVKIIKKKKSDK